MPNNKKEEEKKWISEGKRRGEEEGRGGVPAALKVIRSLPEKVIESLHFVLPYLVRQEIVEISEQRREEERKREILRRGKR